MILWVYLQLIFHFYQETIFLPLLFFVNSLFFCPVTKTTLKHWIPTLYVWNGLCQRENFSLKKCYKNKKRETFLIFWEHLLKAVCVLDHLVFLHLLLLGPIGPLTKKHTDDLSDSDRTDDEGIFSPPMSIWFAWQGKPDLPFLLQFLSSLIFLHFLSFFWKNGHFLFALYS